MAKEIILADWLMKKLPLAERFHEILRFLIVGGGCFLLEYVLLYMLTEFAGIPYLTSSAIAFLISLLVNIFPFHPYKKGCFLSNRTPTDEELSVGLDYTRQLLEITGTLPIFAVGKKSEITLSAAGVSVIGLRHPANGGANIFRKGLKDNLPCS